MSRTGNPTVVGRRRFGSDWIIALGVLAGLGLGCEIDGSIGRGGTAGTGGGTGSVATDGDDTGGSGSATADDAGTSIGSAEGGGTGGSSADTRDTTDQPALCHPTPDDEPCARCRKTACCAAYEACVLHDSCVCWWDCAVTDHSVEECVMLCNSDGVLYDELATCAALHCDSCPTDMP